jgi:hypothetical protein
MRPGTVECSRWDAQDTSSDEEAAAPVRRAAATPPASHTPAPGKESAGAALAPLPAPDGAEDDRLSRVLPVLLAHEGVLRVFGSTCAVEHTSRF